MNNGIRSYNNRSRGRICIFGFYVWDDGHGMGVVLGCRAQTNTVFHVDKSSFHGNANRFRFCNEPPDNFDCYMVGYGDGRRLASLEAPMMRKLATLRSVVALAVNDSIVGRLTR